MVILTESCLRQLLHSNHLHRIKVKLLAVFLPIAFFSLGHSQPNSSSEVQNVSVCLLPSSTISIDGKTNVNRFSCSYTCPFDTLLFPMSARDDQEKSFVCREEIQLKVMFFDCGIAMMNKEFRELLQVEEYPVISIQLEGFYYHQDLCNWMAKSKVRIAKEEKAIDLPLMVQSQSGYGLKITQGSVALNLEDFGITPPVKFGGLVKVDQDVEVAYEFHLLMKPATSP